MKADTQADLYGDHSADLRPSANVTRKLGWHLAIRVGWPAAALALAGCGGESSADGPVPTIVAPLSLPGPYPVACSNVALDFSRLAPGAVPAQAYWEGRLATDGTPRYVDDLVADLGHARSVVFNAPTDVNLFGSFAGQSVPSVVSVCNPTAADNTRLDFALPAGQLVPHMQTGAKAPLLPDPAARYPVIAFSHGLAGSPLSGDQFVVLSWLASFGHVVAAPFHGNPRFTNLQIDDFRDAVTVLANLSDAVARQALRPRAVPAALDLVLAHPHWRDHVHPSQIGGFGASLGGETMMLMGGAALTNSPLDWRRHRSASIRESRPRWAMCRTSGNCCFLHSAASSVGSTT